MAWIESHQSLLNHRKTLRAVALLKVNKYQLIGHLHSLWWWALDNIPADGQMGDISDSEVAAAAGWTKNAENFATALTQAGFIDQDEDGRHLHNWYDYAGKLLVKREMNKERMQRVRATHVHNTTIARAGATVPNRTQPYPTQPNLTTATAVVITAAAAQMDENPPQ